MRYLTTYTGDEINFKFGNTGSILKLKAIDNHEVKSFDGSNNLSIKIKNENIYVKTLEVKGEGREVLLPTNDLSKLPVGQYDVELWVESDKGRVIYPDEGFLKLNINGNATQLTGNIFSSLTLADLEREIERTLKIAKDKIDEKISNITNGKTCIPKITVSDKGTLVIDDEDTGAVIRGEKGDTGVPGRDGSPGENGKSAYQIWLNLGNIGSEQDFIESLKSKSETTARHAPTAWTLDRTTTPWTTWFDNGCGLQFPEYAVTGTVYGYGFVDNLTTTNFTDYPLIPNIIRASRGAITIDKFRKQNGSFDYWSPTTKVINPMQDASKFDWSSAYGDEGTNSGSYGRKPVFARIMYELGIWSEEDVIGLGAKKKG